VRFRKFNDPPGFELFVGVHVPTPAAGRDVTWDLSAPNSVTFTYALGADTPSAGVANTKPGSPFNQTFVNYALAAVPPAVSGDFVPADMNVMVITLTLESTMPVASTSIPTAPSAPPTTATTAAPAPSTPAIRSTAAIRAAPARRPAAARPRRARWSSTSRRTTARTN
jgi:hypothetical protein